MIDFAYGTCGFDVKPEGSKRVWLNLSTRTFNGTPYCRAMEHVVAKLSITPDNVEPSFAITMKISPGVPSSYMPIVRYPSWPATENLCVMECRSTGRCRRTGRLSTTTCGAAFWSLALVLSGCVRLEPSRYTATAFNPKRQPSM